MCRKEVDRNVFSKAKEEENTNMVREEGKVAQLLIRGKPVGSHTHTHTHTMTLITMEMIKIYLYDSKETK